MTAPRTKQLRLFSLLLMLAMAVAALPTLGSTPVAKAAANNVLLWDGAAGAATSTPNFSVVGIDPKNPGVETPISDFKFLIVEDNVGDNSQPRDNGCTKQDAAHPNGDPDYPANCHWTSIQTQTGYAPIVTQGTSADFAAGGLFENGIELPAGNYMISVTAADHKIDGTWFSVPMADGAQFKVQMNTYDLPAATLRAVVFNDNRSTNGQPDLPAEMGITGANGGTAEPGDQPGLAGFRVTVNDTLGEVTNDVFGNPICTVYPIVDGKPDTDNPGPQQINGCLYSSDGTAPDLGNPNAGPLLAGQVAIPNLGPNRYTMLATPPDGTNWVQTATLEGNHDWDAWVQEGSTGYDTEFAVASEPFPWVPFGFVQPTPNPLDGPGTYVANGGTPAWQPIDPNATGGIKGSVAAVTVYTPGVGGIPYSGSIWAGLSGAKYDKPIENPYIAIADLNNGDQTVWVGQGDAEGNFFVPHVPDGTYQISWWDFDQLYLLDWQQVDVKNGQITDVGQLHMTAWYSHLSGRVCTDLNYDGICQANEPGIDAFALTVRRRTNSLIDRGSQGAVTDSYGNYQMDSVYPLTAWLVVEAYSDTYYTTGVTYWADNNELDPALIDGDPVGGPQVPDISMADCVAAGHCIEGAGVDVNFLSIIGQNGYMNWAVQRYNALPFKRLDTNGHEIPHNGGIVGTVSYDTTRNELNPREAAFEDWQVGIPNLTVDLYKPVPCVPSTFVSANGEACVLNPTGVGYYVANRDGSLKTGQLLNQATTESWERPKDCVARGPDGTPLDPQFFTALPLNDGAGRDCVEAPMSGIQYGSDYATVDGNYGFGDYCPAGYDPAANNGEGGCLPNGGSIDPQALPAGDYIVKVEIPTDAYGRPKYQPTREEDINVFTGDVYKAVAPQVAPPACAGALHTVDVKGAGSDGYPQMVGDGANGIPAGVVVPPSTPTDNPDFVDMGGSPFEGQAKPLCDAKLITLGNGRSVAPGFALFTPVPLPGRWFGYIVDDLNLSSNPQDLLFGEKAGVGNSPIGIYDYANRLVRTINSDPNGVFEVLLPSTTTISCPTPTGVCANLYRIVGNDPGIPGRLNPNYNPSFRTISATFEIFPGDIEPSDLAPTQIGVSIQAPGSQLSYPATCSLSTATDTAQPQLFAVDKPYAYFDSAAADRTITIKGQGFGASGSVTFSHTDDNGYFITRELRSTGANIVSWSDNEIVVEVPAANVTDNMVPAPWQLSITNGVSGLSQVNGLTFHVLSGSAGWGYNPTPLEVGPGKTYATIQEAIDRTDPVLRLPGEAGGRDDNPLIVVYPGAATAADANGNNYNPQGAYFENLIVSAALTLQGVGPGGSYIDAAGNNVTVDGSIIDGSAAVGDTGLSNTWRTRMAQRLAAGWLGNQTVYEGAVITAVAPRTGTYNSNHWLTVDGFKIQGGNQQGFPGNLTEIFGLPNGTQVNAETQGGGIFANAYVDWMQVTNNIFQSNGGAYGGAIRIGTPSQPGLNNDNNNVRPTIQHNRFIANGGTNLAGALAIFSGTNGYDVGYNDFCGNFSAEYGGAISHYGLSPNGKIHHNRIWFNRSYDEGGAIMIAGELPADATALSDGAGRVDIYDNLIQANLSNDDGGGIRFLMAGNFPYNVYNNMIVNNISTHEGGGVAIDDAPAIRFFNNTVMKNITTATAVTSDGSPAAAGLSTTMNSDQLQATLNANAPTFSRPLMFNNIFWDNRAGSFDGSNLTGIGAANDSTAINHWDMGVMGGNGGELLNPTYSILQDFTGVWSPSVATRNLLSVDPQVVDNTYNTSILALPWRVMPGAGTGQTLVAVDLPPNLLGDYHLAAGSPAIDAGTNGRGNVYAWNHNTTINVTTDIQDIDGDARQNNAVDIGADEYVTP